MEAPMLSLPNELLHHIGKYAGDASRLSLMQVSKSFRDVFSYIDPRRILPSGHIILERQHKFLLSFVEEVEKIMMRKLRHKRRQSDCSPFPMSMRRELDCVISAGYDPYLMVLLMSKIVSPLLVIANSDSISYIEYTLTETCKDYVSCHRFVRSEVSTFVDHNDPHCDIYLLSKHLISPNLPMGIRFKFICFLCDMPDKDAELMGYREYTLRKGISPDSLLIDISIYDDGKRESMEYDQYYGTYRREMTYIPGVYTRIGTMEDIQQPRHEIIKYPMMEVYDKLSEDLEKRLKARRNGEATQQSNCVQAVSVGLLLDVLDCLYKEIKNLHSLYGARVIVYIEKNSDTILVNNWRLSRMIPISFDNAMKDIETLTADLNQEKRTPRLVDTILPALRREEGAKFQPIILYLSKRLKTLMPQIKLSDVIIINEFDVSYSAILVDFLNRLQFIGEDGNRNISGKIRVHIFDISNFKRALMAKTLPEIVNALYDGIFNPPQRKSLSEVLREWE